MNILIGLFMFWCFIGLLGYIHDKKIYNKGYCEKCNNVLKHYDTDSQDGFGFKCEKCNSYKGWVSWPGIIDKNLLHD